MTLSSNFSNVLIDGNTFEGTSTYNYDLVAEIGTNSTIINNYFSGTINNPTITMLDILNCSCIIKNNTFIRGSNTIPSYINNTGSNDQIITDNIFDGYTVDGTSTTLIASLTANSIYTQNKNQVGYSIIPLGAEKTSIFQFGTSPNDFALFNYIDFPPPSSISNAEVTAGYGSVGRDVYVLKIYNDQVSPTQQYFSLGIDVSKSIPIGAKIIDAKISIYSPQAANALDTTGNNNFFLSLNTSRSHTSAIDVKTYFSSTDASWMNGFSITSSLIITGSNVSNISSNYQVIEIPTLNFTGNTIDGSGTTIPVSNFDISHNYVNGNDYNITANLNFAYKATAGSALFPLLIVSPLIITYVF